MLGWSSEAASFDSRRKPLAVGSAALRVTILTADLPPRAPRARRLRTHTGPPRAVLRESEAGGLARPSQHRPVYDAGEEDGLLYIAMAYVEGSDLKTLLVVRASCAPPYAAHPRPDRSPLVRRTRAASSTAT